MKLSSTNPQATVSFMALVLATGQAFTSSPLTATRNPATSAFFAGRQSTFSVHKPNINSHKAFRLQATALPETDDEIARLQHMAAKLRAEAAALEADQQQAVAQAAEKAFEKFDANSDGQVDLQELKDALEKTFKLELPEQRVEKLMSKFDKSGDGALQIDEFVNVDQFRNQLDAIAREEKAMAREKSKAAQVEQEAAAMMQAQLELINEKEPSAMDKVVSVLPYLFPLLDGLQFARFLVLGNPDNPLALTAATLYGLYRAIPLGGFLAFFALSTLSGNLSINRLIRFNMQQAIFLDIALVIPGLLFGLASLIGGGGADAVPSALVQLGSDGVLVALLAVLGYTTVSSFLGSEPDKIPFISNAVKNRIPTVDMIQDMQQTFFLPRGEQGKNEEDDDKNNMDKKD